MRKIALGVCSAIVCALVCLPASAEPIQSGPQFVNDHDGGVMPNRISDPDFVINPDGDDESGAMPASDQVGQDQDEDGDISMYQGQDDNVPA
ncbi:MAG TPA: hypothetical protein VID67_04870 [Rhizomicrobium sp.]|jgi:hypothetical protein